MEQIDFTFQDIQEYLKIYYDLDWLNYMVFTNEVERKVSQADFGGKYNTKLNCLAILYDKDLKRQLVWLNVTNSIFSVRGYDDCKPPISWRDFYCERLNAEKTFQ